MTEKDNIKDLFSDKLKNYEAKVDPQLWSNISSQLGSVSAPAAGTGMSVLTKIIIGTVVTATVVTSAIIYNQNSEEEAQKERTAVVDGEDVSGTNSTFLPDQQSKGPQRTHVSTESNSISDQDLFVATPEQGSNTEHNEQNSRSEINEMIPVEIERVTAEDEPVKQLQAEEENSVQEENKSASETTDPEEISTQIEEAQTEQIQELRMPDVFTPDNDGFNDYLHLQKENDLSGLKEFQVIVLNNRNQIVYQSNDPLFKWDGTGMDGQMVEAGKYVYFITALDKYNNPVRGHQTLRIMR